MSNEHFSRLRLRCATRHHSKSNGRCRRCSLHAVYTMKSLSNLHKGKCVFTENFGDDALECRWGSLQPEDHDHGYEHALIHHDGGVFLVVQMHTYLIVPANTIQKVVHFVNRDAMSTLSVNDRRKVSVIVIAFSLRQSTHTHKQRDRSLCPLLDSFLRASIS